MTDAEYVDNCKKLCTDNYNKFTSISDQFKTDLILALQCFDGLDKYSVTEVVIIKRIMEALNILNIATQERRRLLKRNLEILSEGVKNNLECLAKEAPETTKKELLDLVNDLARITGVSSVPDKS